MEVVLDGGVEGRPYWRDMKYFSEEFFLTVWVDGGYYVYENKNSLLVVNESGIIGIGVQVIVR